MNDIILTFKQRCDVLILVWLIKFILGMLKSCMKKINVFSRKSDIFWYITGWLIIVFFIHAELKISLWSGRDQNQSSPKVSCIWARTYNNNRLILRKKLLLFTYIYVIFSNGTIINWIIDIFTYSYFALFAPQQCVICVGDKMYWTIVITLIRNVITHRDIKTS